MATIAARYALFHNLAKLDRPAAELLDDPDLNRLFLGGVAAGSVG